MTPINGQRLFSLNGEDYWVGEDLESCIIAARKETGLDDEELLLNPHELSDAALNRMKRRDEDTGVSVTFREALIEDLSDSRTVTPYLFASSNY